MIRINMGIQFPNYMRTRAGHTTSRVPSKLLFGIFMATISVNSAAAVVLSIFSTAVIAAPTDRDSPPLKQWADTHVISDKFTQDVLKPLRLEGATVRLAIGRLVDIGFRCGIEKGSYDSRFKEIPWMSTHMPYVRCTRKLAGGLTGYPTLNVTLQVSSWTKYSDSVEQLYDTLETAVVEDAHSSTLAIPADDFGPVFSSDGAAQLEKKHRKLIQQSALMSDVARTLVLNGFYCGGQRPQDRNDFDEETTETPALVCSINGGSDQCRVGFVSVQSTSDIAEAPSSMLSKSALHVLRTKWQCLAKQS
ncbi:hypothetical protein [Stenotrophobium rhamnosiphilum]|nr:hypothetical protein [Stenotrophobium rhamnosiphilum]